MLTSAYRAIVPKKSRDYIYSLFLGNLLYYKRNFRILSKAFLAYRLNYDDKTELFKTLKFIGKYGIRSCPGEFSLKYDNFTCEVLRDDFPYVIHKGKNLYFPKDFTDVQVKRIYKSLIVEQDHESPHRYSENESDYENTVIFDIGAAEGILTLEKIDKVKSAYLVECEQPWVDALKKTFEPYKDKIKIIFKYIDENDSDTSICLDTLGIAVSDEKVFVKMDVEGFEEKALKGGLSFLKNNKTTVAICTYHKPHHPAKIKELLERIGFSTEFSKGFLYWDFRLSKAVIRGKNYKVN